jgi:hypothetical protein
VWSLLAVSALAAGAAGQSAAANVKTVDITKKTRFVIEDTRGAFRSKNDPARCVAALFVMWPEVPGATKYTVEVIGFNGTAGDTIVAPPFTHDKFPLSSGSKTVVFKVDPGNHWHNFGSYSTGSGCDPAHATVKASIPTRLKIVSATATVDIAKAREEERKKQANTKICPTPEPVDDFWDGAPKGAIGRVAEIHGTRAWIQHKSGKVQPVKFRTWVFPGDIVLTDNKTVVAVDFVTGGRIGINKNVIARVDGDKEVVSIADPSAADPVLAEELHEAKRLTTKLSRVWDKISKRKEPLEVETAGGVTSCKG